MVRSWTEELFDLLLERFGKKAALDLFDAVRGEEDKMLLLATLKFCDPQQIVQGMAAQLELGAWPSYLLEGQDPMRAAHVQYAQGMERIRRELRRLGLDPI